MNDAKQGLYRNAKNYAKWKSPTMIHTAEVCFQGDYKVLQSLGFSLEVGHCNIYFVVICVNAHVFKGWRLTCYWLQWQHRSWCLVDFRCFSHSHGNHKIKNPKSNLISTGLHSCRWTIFSMLLILIIIQFAIDTVHLVYTNFVMLVVHLTKYFSKCLFFKDFL